MRVSFAAVLLIGLPATGGAQAVTVELVPAKALVVSGQEVRFAVRATDASGTTITPPSVVWMVGGQRFIAGVARAFALQVEYEQGVATARSARSHRDALARKIRDV